MCVVTVHSSVLSSVAFKKVNARRVTVLPWEKLPKVLGD
jgi:hypothetical protein